MMTSSELTTCHNLLDMLQDCNGEAADYWSRMLEHIDGQAKRIATMKAICIKERFWQIWKAGECQTVERATQKAKDQLAKEYPEINWDE